MDQIVKIETDVPIAMRDGVKLRADIFRPEGDGPFPTIVMRTPYDKRRAFAYYFYDPIRMARSGYAVVFQDCRGCFTSEGTFYPWRHESKDGYDTIEWAARQNWSNKKVGMYGYSYPGSVQWAAAAERPPHLTAIAPGSSPETVKDLVFRGGVFQLQLAQLWTLTIAAMLRRRESAHQGSAKYLGQVAASLSDLSREARFLPLNGWQIAANEPPTFYRDWLQHPDRDDYWQKLDLPSFSNADLPTYIIGGWYDVMTAAGVLSTFTKLASKGDPRRVKLIMGPWGHEMHLMQKVGDHDFGISAAGDAVDLVGLHLRWFDYWLKGIDNGVVDEAPVRIFVMGDNLWRDENEWPLARTQYTKYYFRSGASSHGGGGGLTLEPPGEEAPESYTYDPSDPVPTEGGSILDMQRGFGPLDQRQVEARTDVLVYSTEPLVSDLETTGPVVVMLYAESSEIDTDFTAKLVDVWPNGEAYVVLDGIVRARYRSSDARPSFIAPAMVYEYSIDLSATSIVFKAGHRVRIEISSSNFPKYDRNTNTGCPIGGDRLTRLATQKIFHDAANSSHVILPVIPR
jgi:putative CocE/NonD family hydrolase